MFALLTFAAATQRPSSGTSGGESGGLQGGRKYQPRRRSPRTTEALRKRGAISKRLARKVSRNACRLPPDLVRISYGGFGDVFVRKAEESKWAKGAVAYKVVPFDTPPRYSTASEFFAEVDLAGIASDRGFGPRVISNFANSEVGVIEMERWAGALSDMTPKQTTLQQARRALEELEESVVTLADAGGLCVDVRTANVLYRRKGGGGGGNDDGERALEMTLSDFDRSQCDRWETILGEWVSDRLALITSRRSVGQDGNEKQQAAGDKGDVVKEGDGKPPIDIEGEREKLWEYWTPIVRDTVALLLLVHASLNLTGWLRQSFPERGRAGSTLKTVFPELRTKPSAVAGARGLLYLERIGALARGGSEKPSDQEAADRALFLNHMLGSSWFSSLAFAAAALPPISSSRRFVWREHQVSDAFRKIIDSA